MTEARYQADLIRRIKRLFPGCEVIKTDTGYIQGLPDLLILWGCCWALLEVKVSANAETQPNQEYYVQHLGEMSFAAFIFPENEEEVLSALQQAFESPGRTCVSKS